MENGGKKRWKMVARKHSRLSKNLQNSRIFPYMNDSHPIYGIVVHCMQSILTKHAKLEGLGVCPKKILKIDALKLQNFRPTLTRRTSYITIAIYINFNIAKQVHKSKW